MDKQTIAERMFDGAYAENNLTEQLVEAGMVDFEDLGFDEYDNSLEIHGVPDDFRLSEAMQLIIYTAGFTRCYVNHVNNWETHYGWKHGEDFKLSDGWRVSYLSKRNDGSIGILVENTVDGWPKEWFDTEYVKIIEKDPKNVQ